MLFTAYNYRQEISTFPRYKPAAFLKKEPGIKQNNHENHIMAWLTPPNRKKRNKNYMHFTRGPFLS